MIVRKMRCSIMMVLVLAGCSREPSAIVEETVSASGQATYQGKPIDYYQIVLTPIDQRRAAAGITDANGRFVLGTNGADDGAVAGMHQVSVTYVGPPIEQEPGKEEAIVPPSAKVKVPEKFSNPNSSGVLVEIPEAGTSDLKIELQ